jgi:hypothetical protein
MKLFDKRNFAAEGADPPPAGPATGFSRLERAQQRRRHTTGSPIARRPCASTAPFGRAGYPEGKKTGRSEGPESLRYIARSQVTVRAAGIKGVRRTLDGHPSMT